jgi:ABC-type branched-subunit amino acid transport system substrate-binding protein
MSCKFRMAAVFLSILVMLVPLSVGCGGGGGGGGGGGKVTITIGEINDLTGPASPAIIPLHWAIQDMIRYYNDENLIEGVKFRLVTWDDQWNPSRAVPGYDWLKSKGAKVIECVPNPSAAILKSFADREKFPILCMTTNEVELEPPGWVFCFSNSFYRETKTFLKWIHDVNWDYSQGIPKIGLAAWDDLDVRESEKALKEYSQDHPDQIEYVGGRFAPYGQVFWTAEVEALKGCDYIQVNGMGEGEFMKEFQNKGYKTQFFDIMTAASYRGFLVNQQGWKVLDGFLSINPSAYWTESFPVVDLAKTLVYRYHSKAEADSLIYAGMAYVGGIRELVNVFGIVGEAIKAVGAENFSQQSVYDAAVTYKTEGPIWEGYPPLSFSQTKRYLSDQVFIYRFDASVEDLVRVGDWLPLS